MNKLSKEKRDRILMVAAGGGALIAAIWFMLLAPQKAGLAEHLEKIAARERDLSMAERMTGGGEAMMAELEELRERLARIENQMIPTEQVRGKMWVWDHLGEFINGRHRVQLHRLSDPIIGNQFLFLPNFPYAAAAYNVELLAHYHDFGKFLADFESSFPFTSIQNVQISPLIAASTGPAVERPEVKTTPEGREKLLISMRIVHLFKPWEGR